MVREVGQYGFSTLTLLYALYLYLDYDTDRTGGLTIVQRWIETLPWALFLSIATVLFCVSVYWALQGKSRKAARIGFLACILGWFFFVPTTCGGLMVAQFMLFTTYTGFWGWIVPNVVLLMMTRYTHSQIQKGRVEGVSETAK